MLLDAEGNLPSTAQPILHELEQGWLERVWAGDPASGA
jgi:hypothetical protein